MRHRSLRRPFVLLGGLAALLVAAGCGPDLSPLLQDGVSLDLARHRAETLSDVRYAVELRLPESAELPVEGAIEVRFRRIDPADLPVVLDFREAGDRVASVEVNGRRAPLRTSGDHLVVPARLLRAQDDQLIRVEFRAGDGSLNRKSDFLYTLFVPDRAHTAVPLFDQPDLRARFSLTLELPPEWVALSNGGMGTPVLDGHHAAPGVRLDFPETPPIPSYLFAFVAGRFERVSGERDGRAFTFLHRETDRDRVNRNIEEIFRLHAASLDWLEEYTGVEYPFAEFGFAAIPDFQYGGMEHPGAIFYRAGSLFLEDAATRSQQLGRASLIAHETAHMWFGNLVTMAWFDDVWMKEVFANFMAARMVHPSFPDVDHRLRFLLAHHPAAYGVDRTPGTHPIRQTLGNLNEAGSLYGAIIYQKAPIMMNQLERVVGPEGLREGLREYLDRYGFGNATWPDLIEILDGHTPEDLSEWSRVWVGEAGRPEVRVDRATGRVVQTDPAGRGLVWGQDLEVLALPGAMHSPNGWSVRLRDGWTQLEPWRGPASGALLPDVSGLAYGRMVLDEESTTELLARLPDVGAPLVRGSAWVYLMEELLEGNVGAEAYLDAVLRSVPVEADDLLLQRILSDLREVYWRFLPAPVREARAEEVEGVLRGAFLEASSVSTRTALLGSLRSVSVTSSGLAWLRELWAEEVVFPDFPLPEQERTALALELALKDGRGAAGILDREEARIENPDRLARFRFLRRSVDPDPTVRMAFFQALSRPENRNPEPWATAGLQYLNHPVRGQEALGYIAPALALLPEIQRTGDIFFPKAWVDALLSGHNSPEAVGRVEGFLDESPELPLRLRQKLLQAADPVVRASRIAHPDGGGEA